MKRIVVGGGPGNGKSTLARDLAMALDLTHVELDALYHRPGWDHASDEEFRSLLVAALDDAPEGWTTCGNYLSLCDDIHIARADTFVWLDLPRTLVTRRVAARTLRRAVTRERLFGQDIREPLTNFYRWDPEVNVIRWAWHHHPIYRVEYARRLADPRWAHLNVYHLRSVAEVDEFRRRAIAPAR